MRLRSFRAATNFSCAVSRFIVSLCPSPAFELQPVPHTDFPGKTLVPHRQFPSQSLVPRLQSPGQHPVSHLQAVSKFLGPRLPVPGQHLFSQSLGDMASGKDGDERNLAAWLIGPRDIQLKDFPLPDKLGPHDVRVAMKCVGICGSDVHYYAHFRCGPFVVKDPMVLGHESSGVVLEVGPAVTRCAPGDKVALEPGGGCGRCRYCKGGRYNLCPDMKFFATPPVHGSLARQVVHPEDLCFVLPEGVSLEEGALCEPLSVGVHACRRAGDLAGANVAVMGAGPIGLVTVMVAKAFGASRVAVCDISTERLQMAAAMGADEWVASCVPTEVSAEAEAATAQELATKLGGRVDVVFDCVGRGATMRTGLSCVSAGGKVLLVGMADSSMEVPLTEAASREVDILGVFRYCNDYETAIDLLRRQAVNVMPLLTHKFAFTQESVVEAYKTSERGGKAVKVMITV